MKANEWNENSRPMSFGSGGETRGLSTSQYFWLCHSSHNRHVPLPLTRWRKTLLSIYTVYRKTPGSVRATYKAGITCVDISIDE